MIIQYNYHIYIFGYICSDYKENLGFDSRFILSEYKGYNFDNILRKPRSLKQHSLLSDLVDPFFLARLYNRQPTILVFKFDIRDKSFDIENTFGVGISRIIDSRRTFKIPLCEKYE